MPEIKKKSAFSRAMMNTNEWLMGYAKFMCNFSNKGRLKIYRKLAALLRNRFSLMNALDMIYNGLSDEGQSPNEPMAIAIASCCSIATSCHFAILFASLSAFVYFCVLF